MAPPLVPGYETPPAALDARGRGVAAGAAAGASAAASATPRMVPSVFTPGSTNRRPGLESSVVRRRLQQCQLPRVGDQVPVARPDPPVLLDEPALRQPALERDEDVVGGQRQVGPEGDPPVRPRDGV